MKIARYWAKGVAETIDLHHKKVKVASWGWSEKSQEEAVQSAQEAVQKAAARVAAGEAREREYEYLRPPREEIVEELNDSNGVVVATITRNTYGSLILNTKDLMFIDVDIPYKPPVPVWWAALRRLLGNPIITEEERIGSRLLHLVKSQLNYTTRLYRTHAGYRCVIINKPIDPTSKESDSLFTIFEADPLYVRLCKNQACYRARLTPKHWRLGFKRPPNRYPWESGVAEQRYRQWEQEYARQSGPFATCRLVGQFGAMRADEALKVLVDFHDKVTQANTELPLA